LDKSILREVSYSYIPVLFCKSNSMW
jgi:hypothetical protein